MAYDIGTARGVIEMEYNGRGVTEAEKGLKDLEKSGGSVKQQLDKTARAASIGGAAIAAGLGFAVNAAANFEQRMSAIQAVSGATGSQMDQIRGKALQLGKDTVFSAGEAGQAIEELIKAGLSVPDVLNGAADATVNLAAAGEIDLPQAATIAANAMNQFNLSAQDMPKVADAIAGAANASAIDVGQFGESLQQVGAVANLAGVNFKDTATAIAIMGNAGIAGSDAGTSLKSMFQRLQPVTKKQGLEMQKLGLITKDGTNKFYDQQGRIKSLAQISQILQNSTKNMTKQQRQMALQILFGSDAIRGAAILSNAGSKGFDKMAKSMDKVKAADVAKTRMDNLKGSIEQMKGSLETAGIALGTIMLPALRQLVDHVTAALNWFLNLNPALQKTAVILAIVTGSVLLIVAALIKMIQFVKSAQEAFFVLKAAAAEGWLATLGPILLVAAAIAAIIVIIVLLWKHSETFRKIVTGAWNGIKTAASATLNFLKGVPGFFVSMWNKIQDAFSTGINWIKAHWLLLLPIFLGPLGAVIALVIKFHTQIIGFFQSIISTIKGIWSGFWGSAFGGLIKAALGVVLAILNLWWVIVKGLFILNMRLILGTFKAIWTAIVTVVRAAIGIVKSVISAGIGFIVKAVRADLQLLRSIWGAIWGAIAAVARAIWGRIGGTVTAGANHVKGVVTAAWNAVKGVTSNIWNTVVGIIRDAVGRLVGIINTIKSKVTGALSGAASWLYSKGKEIIQGLIDGMTSMLNKVSDTIHSVTDKIGKFLPGSPVDEGPLKKLNKGKAGKDIVQFVIDGISSMARPLADAAADAFGSALPVGYAGAGPGALAGPTRKGRAKGKGRLRMIRGELDLSRSGRAFIRGVAEDADDDGDDYSDTVGRMGGS